jgi:hypothetical protein
VKQIAFILIKVNFVYKIKILDDTCMTVIKEHGFLLNVQLHLSMLLNSYVVTWLFHPA